MTDNTMVKIRPIQRHLRKLVERICGNIYSCLCILLLPFDFY